MWHCYTDVTCTKIVTLLHWWSKCNPVTCPLQFVRLFVCCNGSTHFVFHLHFCLLLCSFLNTIPLDVQNDSENHYLWIPLPKTRLSETEVRSQSLPRKFPLLACQSKFASWAAPGTVTKANFHGCVAKAHEHAIGSHCASVYGSVPQPSRHNLLATTFSPDCNAAKNYRRWPTWFYTPPLPLPG